jgi:hypothetical protein
MRTILAGLALAMLAACGGAATNANDSAANSSAPVGNATAPDKPANASAAVDPARADEIGECTQDVANELPAGTDVNAFCNCAVDGMQGGRGERAAMEACAAQMGIESERR